MILIREHIGDLFVDSKVSYFTLRSFATATLRLAKAHYNEATEGAQVCRYVANALCALYDAAAAGEEAILPFDLDSNREATVRLIYSERGAEERGPTTTEDFDFMGKIDPILETDGQAIVNLALPGPYSYIVEFSRPVGYDSIGVRVGVQRTERQFPNQVEAHFVESRLNADGWILPKKRSENSDKKIGVALPSAKLTLVRSDRTVSELLVAEHRLYAELVDIIEEHTQGTAQDVATNLQLMLDEMSAKHCTIGPKKYATGPSSYAGLLRKIEWTDTPNYIGNFLKLLYVASPESPSRVERECKNVCYSVMCDGDRAYVSYNGTRVVPEHQKAAEVALVLPCVTPGSVVITLPQAYVEARLENELRQQYGEDFDVTASSASFQLQDRYVASVFSLAEDVHAAALVAQFYLLCQSDRLDKKKTRKVIAHLVAKASRGRDTAPHLRKMLRHIASDILSDDLVDNDDKLAEKLFEASRDLEVGIREGYGRKARAKQLYKCMRLLYQVFGTLTPQDVAYNTNMFIGMGMSIQYSLLLAVQLYCQADARVLRPDFELPIKLQKNNTVK